MHRPMVVTIMAICTQQRPETDFREGRGYGQREASLDSSCER
jgi:hypothetical protein